MRKASVKAVLMLALSGCGNGSDSGPPPEYPKEDRNALDLAPAADSYIGPDRLYAVTLPAGWHQRAETATTAHFVQDEIGGDLQLVTGPEGASGPDRRSTVDGHGSQIESRVILTRDGMVTATLRFPSANADRAAPEAIAILDSLRPLKN